MNPGPRGPLPLRAYLRPGPDQYRLIVAMANGHARHKHGQELGATSPGAFRARAQSHLAAADRAFAVTDETGRRRYLVTDANANRVAWIVPHREQRSTLFAPRRGVAHYVSRQRLLTPTQRWRALDPARLRAPQSHRIASADRARERAGPSR